LTVAGWVVLALLPYCAIYVVHFSQGPKHPSGFILYDAPYYVASGREIFERGNGWAYPNPYDPSPDSPAIYCQWLVWIFGFGVSVLGLSPGVWFVTVGAVGAGAMALLTWHLIARLVRPRGLRPWAFLSAMWGGGAFVLWTAAENLLGGEPIGHDVFRHDFFDGWWFPTWGRNVVLPTEAAYHALVAGAWLALVAGRPLLSAGLVLALAATHPFSGAQHLLILITWFSLRAVLARDRTTVVPLLVTLAGALAFVWYYLLFLPAHPSHVEIQRDWAIDWPMTLGGWLSYAFVLPLAAARLVRATRRGRIALRTRDWFFLVAAGVSLLLIYHDLFVSPRQQMHFTRGYLWMPLFLLGLPLLVAFVRTRRCRSGARRRLALAAIVAITAVDNLTWCAQIATLQPQSFYFSDGEADLVTQLDEARLQGVALAPYPLGYLLATYTHLIPYLGHMHLTPRFGERVAKVAALFGGADAELPAEIDWMIVPHASYAWLLPRLGAFEPALRNDELLVLRRVRGRRP
jgi:hypothetical protein